jgi:outer membrane protein assembly factor BamC
MKIRNTAVLVLALLSLAACSADKQRVNYKSGVSQVSPLEIPPDLTSIASTEQYSIPGANGELVANFSDYSKGVSAQQGGSDSTAVLPVLTNRHMERNGTQHWIVVEDKAENVWPGIKAFWKEMGFKIAVDNPQAGVMETDWLENHGNVPKSYVRHVLGNGKAVDILKSEGIRDQYVTRIERSKDGLSTEIHISSQVMKEARNGGRKEIKWLPHENDPEIEIAVLQMLMARLGNSAPDVPALQNAASSAVSVAEAGAVQLKETATGKVIQINEPFDRSWRRVGLALDSAHIVTTDKDRSKGIYFVSPQPGKTGKKQQPDYQVTVRASSDGCEVTVTDQNGKSDADAARIFDLLYQSIGNNPAKGIRSSTDDKSGSPSGDAVRSSR